MERKDGTPLPDRLGEVKQRLLEENRAVQAALENKSRLIDNMAHQIRTLSNAIIGFSELLGAEDLDASLKEYVTEILQAGRALSNLVNDVLDIAMLDSGKLILSTSYCDLFECLENLYEVIAPAAKQKGLAFSIVADANVPSRILTDGERMLKCLINLATNAVKYTHRGHIRLSISLVEDNKEPWLRFDIEDSGEGLSTKRMSRIFDDVDQTENANRSVLSDMDMGLSITGSLPVTKRLVHAMGGKVAVSSIPGEGTTFSILLPAGLDIQIENRLDLSNTSWSDEISFLTKTTTKTASGINPSEKINTGNVLLVEDMESNRVVITLLLEAIGIKVTSAKDGQEAVDKGLSESFDLILMDLMLPKISGYEATRILRENNIKTPIIALSAGVIGEDDSQRITEQFDAMLSKPVDGKKLQQTMREYLPGFKAASASDGTKTDSSDDEIIIEYSN